MFSYLKPVDKVIEGLEQHETVFAKDQPEYIPLHALVAKERESRVMSRWTFTPEQRKAIAEGADLYLTLHDVRRPAATNHDPDCRQDEPGLLPG